MEYALLAKLLVEAVAATAVLLAAILFLRDRRAARAAELSDRAAERASLLHLLDNAVAHNTTAIDANTAEHRAAAAALGRLTDGLDKLSGRLADRPCLRHDPQAPK